MRALCVVAIVCIALVSTEGCKRHKREPLPGPQSWNLGISAATFGLRPHHESQHDGALQNTDSGAKGVHHGAGGIAWFQGSVEEAFSRDAPRGGGQTNQHIMSCPGTMPTPEIRGSSSARDAV